MDEGRDKAKELIDLFEKKMRKFRERKEKGELGTEEQGTDFEDMAEVLSKMVAVYKEHTTEGDDEEDLMKSLRSVKKAAQNLRGPIASFVKIFVLMHTHYLETRGSGTGSEIPSVSHSQEESSSTLTSSPSTTTSISVPSSSSSLFTPKEKKSRVSFAARSTQETVLTSPHRPSTNHDQSFLSPVLLPLPETPKRKRESTVVDVELEKENRTMKIVKSEDTEEERKKKKRRTSEIHNLTIDMNNAKLDKTAFESSTRRRRSMGGIELKREEMMDTVACDTVGSIDEEMKEGSVTPDVVEVSEGEFCEVLSSSTPGRAKAERGKKTINDYFSPTNREAAKRVSLPRVAASDVVMIPVSTSLRMKEKIEKETMYSPRSKRARATVVRNPMVPEPAHHGRGGADSWECGGLSCSLKLTTSDEIYTHMQYEHYLDGPVVAKCLDCAKIGVFKELIEHRKSGDKSTCGGEHAKLAYWCVVEEKKNVKEMDEDEKEKKKDKEATILLCETLRNCIHKKCNRHGERFDTFKLLDEHNEKVHSCHLLYSCPNPACLRTFTHPIDFIRHRLPSCQGAIPIIKRKAMNINCQRRSTFKEGEEETVEIKMESNDEIMLE